MAETRITHPIADNKLLINEKEYFGLGITKVIIGVETTELGPDGEYRREIIRNERGLSEGRRAVEGQEVYNLSTQKHHPWFILDLETGKHGWYPGCVIKGDILEPTELKETPNDESATLRIISNATVTILNIDALDQEPNEAGRSKVSYDLIGYVRKASVTNLHYACS